MSLPFSLSAQARLRCPHCQKDEICMRSVVFIGATRRCPHCREAYVVRDRLSVVAPPPRVRRPE